MFPHTKPPAGTQINPLHPLSKGLVGCWLFNEGAGSLANDSSGYKNHGRLTNMAPNVHGSGWGSGGLEFDGVDDYVGMGDILDMGLSDCTISTWIKTAQGDVLSGVAGIFKAANVANRYGLYTSTGAANKIRGLFVPSIGNNIVINSSSNINDDIWHKVVVVYDRDGLMSLYFDGIFNGSINISAYKDVNMQSSFNFDIGTYRDADNNPDNFFDGCIRFVHTYNRVLSAEEITWSSREPYAMFEPAFNPAILYSAVPPVGAIMNQFQGVNVGADLYNGAIIA